MGILGELGVEGSIPSIDLTGFFSSSWIYLALVCFVGFILVIGVLVMIFFLTYKKKIILFENIAGQGYQPVLRTRARVVKLGISGQEILKTLVGGYYVSAYGRKMGKNTYWYAKGQDGYWYNILLGDLDSKQAMLDIEPIDRDVRMFHIALDRLSHQTYGKQNLFEKYAIHLLLFVFLIVLILGMWFIVGKIGEAVAPLAQSTELALKIQKSTDATIDKLDNLIRAMGQIPTSSDSGGSGLAPAG